MASLNLFSDEFDRKEEKRKGVNSAQRDEELLVFGYACKVFRDETTYDYIEDEKHLIPWMGDATTLIDRYDGRGHLHDLSEFDADLPSNRVKFTLSEEERRIEEICDQERYVDLHKDVEMEKFYQEEEMKRFYAEQKEYGAVSFKYDESAGEPPSAEAPSELTANDELVQFTPPVELLLPEGMRAPETVKMNAIIEKTATFVATQGLQMEILIKAKQRANSQFEFLDCDHYLNPYYRQMLKMIKDGSYKPKCEEKKEEDEDNDDETNDEDDEGYLHPSLFACNSAPKEPPMKPHPPVNILDTAYGQLLRNLNIPILSAQEKAAETKSPVMPINEESSSSSNADDSNSSFGLSDINWGAMDPTCLANYSGAFDNSLVPPPPPPPPGGPPPDALLVIDKLALYVARNGPQFEGSIRVKRDARFGFLEPHHPYNAYYEQKKLEMMEEMRKEKAGEFNRDGNRNISFSFKEMKKNAAENDVIIAPPPPPRPAVGPNALAALQQAQQIASQINQNFAQMASIKPLSTVTEETFKPEPKKAFGPEPPPPEIAQRMKAQQIAEQKLRDHLQGKKSEEDVRAERKRKVQMFYRMLKKGKIDASGEKTPEETEAADNHAGRDNGTADLHRESSRSKSRSKAPSPHRSSHHRHRHHHHRHHHKKRSRSPPRAFAVVRR